jgi:predicted DsbA family dithiol-disulfide isomerase
VINKVVVGRILLIALGFTPFLLAQSASCTGELSVARKEALLQYVRAKYHVPAAVQLNLSKDQSVEGTCNRRLTFETRTPLAASTLVLYLTPDQRFLASELLDTSLSPAEEEKRESAAWLAGMTEGRVPALGPHDAPVTIVEFSDFQCPYCKRFNEILHDVSLDHENARVVFHHFPLVGHAWARTAAQAAACAQMQSDDAFWSMHNKFFDGQAAINVENIKQKAAEYAQNSKLNIDQFKSCLDNDLSLGIIFKDEDLASANNVTATPTLFINGKRVQGVKDEKELLALIKEAQANIRVASASVPATAQR